MEEDINKLEYEGELGKIFKIRATDLLRLILTYRFYEPWVQIKTRRYVFGNLKLASSRFKYTGTGGELFKGFFLIFILSYLLPFLYDLMKSAGVNLFKNIEKLITVEELIQINVKGLLYEFLLIMLFVSCYDMLVYVSYRYNFSRITWREAQIRLVGSPFRYAGKKVLYRFLNILSLGLLIHRFDVAMYDYLIHQAQYGGVPFSFQKTPIGSLRRTNIITLLLVPSTFGLSRLWYWAALRRYKFNHTTIGNLRLKATDTGPGLLMLLISTIFLLLVIGIVLTMIVAFNNGLLLLIAGIAFLLVAIPFAQSSIIQLFVVYRASHTFVLGDLETFQKIQEEAALGASIVPEKASDFDSDYGLIQLF